MEYDGKLYWDGENPRIQNKNSLTEWLKNFPEDSWFSIVINPIGNINTTKQHKLYHKWVDILASEWGYTHKEMHSYLKDEYNNKSSTKGMDTKQWSEYMIKVQAFANGNDINLPVGLNE